MQSMHRIRRLTLAALGLGAPLLAFGAPETLDNFRLTDQQGASHELYYLTDKKAVVLLAQGSECKGSQAAAATLEGLRAKYEPQGITFLQINSNLPGSADGVSRPTVATHTTKGMPLLVDDTQLIGESLGLKRNGEVLIANPQGWKVTYRGGVGAVRRCSTRWLRAVQSRLPRAKLRAARSRCPSVTRNRRTHRSRTRRRSRRC